eukprot:jgi/Botrbrau1/4960/Bobra.0122s0035.1
MLQRPGWLWSPVNHPQGSLINYSAVCCGPTMAILVYAANVADGNAPSIPKLILAFLFFRLTATDWKEKLATFDNPPTLPQTHKTRTISLDNEQQLYGHGQRPRFTSTSPFSTHAHLKVGPLPLPPFSLEKRFQYKTHQQSLPFKVQQSHKAIQYAQQGSYAKTTPNHPCTNDGRNHAPTPQFST